MLAFLFSFLSAFAAVGSRAAPSPAQPDPAPKGRPDPNPIDRAKPAPLPVDPETQPSGSTAQPMTDPAPAPIVDANPATGSDARGTEPPERPAAPESAPEPEDPAAEPPIAETPVLPTPPAFTPRPRPDPNPAPQPDPVAESPAPLPAPAPQPDPTPIPAPAPQPDPTPTKPAAPPAQPDPANPHVSEPSTDFGSDGAHANGPEQTPATPYEDAAALKIAGGRVTTLKVAGDDAIRVEITDLPEYGNATVNPDNTIALVLSGTDYSGPLSLGYKITYADGSVETLPASFTVAPPTQQAGWGTGNHYMLEEDETGDLIVETGDNHRKVYVSGSDDALTRADIAALEGVNEDEVTGGWLMNHPEYGASEGLALETELGMDLWYKVTSPHIKEPSSHWLLFERGYAYEGTGRLVSPKLNGEDELHPIHITSWGEGERPVITDKVYLYQYDTSNIVFSDLTLTGGVLSATGKNVIFHDMLFTDEGLNIQHGDKITLHDSEVTHVVNDPPKGAAYWSGTKAGLFSNDTSGWLIEGTIFHHNGWEDDYRMDWSTKGGMPPNMFSHNVYLQNDTTDVTFRDNIVAQGSSFGAHIRGGGYVEDNLFLDNNVAVDLLGGIYAGDGPIGNFTLFTDNVITSGPTRKPTVSSAAGHSG